MGAQDYYCLDRRLVRRLTNRDPNLLSILYAPDLVKTATWTRLMRAGSTLRFALRSAVAGLALAFMVVAVKPELLVDSPSDPALSELRPPVASTGIDRVSYAEAVAGAAPAVVSINTAKLVLLPPGRGQGRVLKRFFGDGSSPTSGVETRGGSGVLLRPQGYIVTNNHLIQGADEIEVALHTGRTARAVVVGTDPETDLAVLKIDATGLPALSVDESVELRVGDVVLAIGNPFGVGQTVTMGIVSAIGRSRLGINTFEDFIQTDAAINPGNSGGALINAHGRLIGINTAIFSGSGGSHGIGFAIPATLADEVMRHIIERGYVPRGWLSIDVREINRDIADWFGIGDQRGVLVTGVVMDSPADRDGVLPGDIIVAVGGTSVSDAREALNSIASASPGTKVKLGVIRNGRARYLEVVVGQRPRIDA